MDTSKYKIQWGIGAQPSEWKDYNENGTTAEAGLPVLTENGTIAAKIVEISGGNEKTGGTFTVDKIDKNAPTINVNDPGSEAQSFTLTATASDGSGESGINESSYEFYWNVANAGDVLKQGPNSSKSCSYSLEYDKTTKVFAKVKDNAGNVGTSEVRSITPPNPTPNPGDATKYNYASQTWKIFYQDNSNTYLITDQSVQNLTLYENNVQKTGSTSNIPNDPILTPHWTVSDFTSHLNDGHSSWGYGNKGALYLLDQTKWTTYKNTDATYAIGGPTLDLFILAYNKVKGTSYTVSAGTYGPQPSVYYSNIKYSSSDAGGIFYNGTDTYWLATPHCDHPNTVHRAYIGDLHWRSCSEPEGVRPVVCIPNSTFNAKYKLNEGEFTDANPEELDSAKEPETYGDLVPKYTTGYNDWRIFYKDNKNTFLITDKTATETDLTGSHSTTTTSKVANALNPTWSGSWNTSWTGNTGALYLLQPSSWITYKDTDAAYAVGGPSLDLYIKSWNATQKTSYTVTKGTYGVYPSTWLSGTSGKCNNIYYGGSTRTTGSSEDYWWLASPCYSSNVAALAEYNGGLFDYGGVNNTFGVRPVVCIPTSTFNSKYK